MTPQLLAHRGERRRQIPVLERGAVTQGTGLAYQHRQIVPGVVDDLVALEAARVIGDRLAVEQHDDPIGIGAHQHGAASGSGIDAVLVAVMRDQAGRGRPHRLLDEAGEGPQIRHQPRLLLVEDLDDKPVAELGVLRPPGIGHALIGKPGVQLIERLHLRPWPEQLVADRANLVLDLALLPAGRRRAGHRLDEMMRAHLQKAPVVLPGAPDEDRLHRRLHVVVDAAPADPAVKGEGLVVCIEDHLLRLAEIGAHDRHAAIGKPHLRDLHHDGQAVKLDRLVAPVELIGFARIKPQRDESLRRQPGAIGTPSLHEPVDAVMRPVISVPAQFLEKPDRRAPLASGQPVFCLQDAGQRLHPGPELPLRLNLALVGELGRAGSEHLADRVARNAQLARDPLDPLAVLEMLETDPTNRLHTRHPRTLPKNRKDQPEPITGGLTFNAISAPHIGNIAGDLTLARPANSCPQPRKCW